MFIMLRMIVVGLSLAAASVASAQDMSRFDPSEPAFETAIRVKYEKSEQLPDSIAFFYTMGTLKAMSADDLKDGARFVQFGMGLDEAAALEFNRRMLTELEAVNAEVTATTTKAGCDSGVPKVYGDDVYESFERMDDMRETVIEKHYQAFQKSLDAETAARLHQWMRVAKGNITHVKFNQKEAWQMANRDGNAHLAEFCQRTNGEEG